MHRSIVSARASGAQQTISSNEPRVRSVRVEWEYVNEISPHVSSAPNIEECFAPRAMAGLLHCHLCERARL
jgi:hypothetical protein